MTLCHGPGCTKEASGDFCSESCWRRWHGQTAIHVQPAATIQIEWEHPYLGRIVEHVCEKHDQVVLRALRVLGIGCGGTSFEASECVRCVNDGRRAREWLKACVVDTPLSAELNLDSPTPALPPAESWAPSGIGAEFPQVASNDPQVELGQPGWLGRLFERLFGKGAA